MYNLEWKMFVNNKYQYYFLPVNYSILLIYFLLESNQYFKSIRNFHHVFLFLIITANIRPCISEIPAWYVTVPFETKGESTGLLFQDIICHFRKDIFEPDFTSRAVTMRPKYSGSPCLELHQCLPWIAPVPRIELRVKLNWCFDALPPS